MNQSASNFYHSDSKGIQGVTLVRAERSTLALPRAVVCPVCLGLSHNSYTASVFYMKISAQFYLILL